MGKNVGFSLDFVLSCVGAVFNVCEPVDYVPYGSSQPRGSITHKPRKDKRLRKSSSDTVYRRSVRIVQINEEYRSKRWTR